MHQSRNWSAEDSPATRGRRPNAAITAVGTERRPKRVVHEPTPEIVMTRARGSYSRFERFTASANLMAAE